MRVVTRETKPRLKRGRSLDSSPDSDMTNLQTTRAATSRVFTYHSPVGKNVLNAEAPPSEVAFSQKKRTRQLKRNNSHPGMHNFR